VRLADASTPEKRISKVIRRAIDIVAAVVVLIVLAPILPIICVAIVLDSPGNPFYGGWRVGRGGRPFRMWKFRTMVPKADLLGAAVTTRYDPRITRMGKLLRKTKLDELPQFANLLLGNITLVGPRPEDPEIASYYTDEQKQVLNAKPGITGPTQLYFTAVEAETIPEGPNAKGYYLSHILGPKLRMDLEYLKSRTLFSDLAVIGKTALLMTGLPVKSKAQTEPSL
jgi:lipopolysaccharide/colanic/teichoic acid biosynthesis glycosyltransferase